MTMKNNLGRYIAERRRNTGLTQEELGDRIHVTKSAVAKWETGGGIPDRDNLKSLSEVFHVSADELYRIIRGKDYVKKADEINITADVVAVLESYGYRVYRPDGEEENGT